MRKYTNQAASELVLCGGGASWLMTVRDLSQLSYMDMEIKRLEELRKKKASDLEGLRSRSTSMTVNMSGMPRSASPRNNLEDIIALIDEKEREIISLDKRIQKKRILYESVKQELEEEIETCDDCRIALILKLRFVDLLSWQQVANRIGGKNTADGVRKACDRYLRKKLP